jgi:type IV secretion system protein VirB6
MLATTVAYSDWVTTPLFHTLPDALTAAISGQASSNQAAAFDQFFAHAAYLGEKISQIGGLGTLPAAIFSSAVVIIGALAAALGFGVSLIAKLALALLVALGPAFIACALFDASRRFFFGWIGQAVNYLILMALIVAVLQLVISFLAEQWSQIDGADAMTGGVMFIALCLVATIFFLHLPSLASGLAGGASAGVSDFTSAAGQAWRAARQRPSSRGSGPEPAQGGRLTPASEPR